MFSFALGFHAFYVPSVVSRLNYTVATSTVSILARWGHVVSIVSIPVARVPKHVGMVASRPDTNILRMFKMSS